MSAFLFGCGKPADQTASPASTGGTTSTVAAGAGGSTGVPVGQPGGEIEAVKATLTKMSQEKELTAIGPYLSNRTAAVFGLVLALPLMMMPSFADMGEALGKALAGGSSQAQPAAKKDPKVAELKAELDALGKKYGLRQQLGDPQEAKQIESRGREFFQDVAKLYDKLSKTELGKGKTEVPNPKDIVKNLESVEYRVVSPQEVQLIAKDKKEKPARMIVEDGAWRLDAGGMDEMNDRTDAKGSAPGKP